MFFSVNIQQLYYGNMFIVTMFRLGLAIIRCLKFVYYSDSNLLKFRHLMMARSSRNIVTINMFP
jgi:hypothetical protein